MVPQTASFPMSPPGKQSGRTTKASVVKAMRSLGSERRAASPIAASEGFERCLTKNSRISSRLIVPPPPCAIITTVFRMPYPFHATVSWEATPAYRGRFFF